MNAPVHAEATHPVAALFGEHGTFVFRALRYFGVQDDAADDALQDVFATAYRRWSSFEGRAAPRTWLYGISRRVAYRYRRSARSRGERFVFAEVERPDRPFEQVDARATVAALLAGLDDRKREAFVLVEIEGLTAPEAAAALELPLGTVYSRVRAAWQSLRQAGHVDRAAVASLERPKMSPGRQRSAYRAVVAVCSPSLAPAVAAAGVSGWLIAVGVGVAGIAAVGLGRAVSKPDGPSAPSVKTAPANTESRTKAPKAATSPGREPKQAQAESAAGAAASEDGQGTPAPSDTPATARDGRGSWVRTPRADPVDEASNLAAEIKLLRGSQAAQDRGDTAEALRLLRGHARRFPTGQLAQEREEALAKLAEHTAE